MPSEPIKHIVVVSDLHSGCRTGLCTEEENPLDDGGTYHRSEFQRKGNSMWREFHDEWVPSITKGKPHILVVNGDAIEGVHHRATTPISHNIGDQLRIAESALRPEVAKAAAYYHVRGTEAHVGPSAEYEERLAKTLGATPNDEGQHSRWSLWMEMGGGLIHFLHHIGTTGSSAYESTAVFKELNESYVEAGRWGDKPPNVIVRSHRHRYLKCEIASDLGRAIAVVTPAWQGLTPFTWRIPGARQSQPQFGGIVICVGEDGLYVREKVWRLERPRPVVI